MTTRTLYHVTDASNADSIKSERLLSDDRGMNPGLVFLTDSVEEALHIGEIYPTIDDPVVFKAEVREYNLKDDPDPHGDLNSFAHTGDIPSHDVEQVA